MLQTSTTLENYSQVKTTIINYILGNDQVKTASSSKLTTENGLFLRIYGSNKLTDYPRFPRDTIITQYGAYKLNQEKQTPHYYTKTQTTERKQPQNSI